MRQHSQEPEPEPTVVRLYVGHAESPVWLFGPRDYEDMHLGDALTDDLRDWEAQWYASRETDTFTWVGGLPEVEHRRLGVDLAQRTARALGSGFVVEVDPVDDTAPPGGATVRRRIRSHGPPTSPDAAAQFTEWAVEEALLMAELAENPAVGGWTLHAPLSGHTFSPARKKRRR